jgi:hypothetical protein
MPGRGGRHRPPAGLRSRPGRLARLSRTVAVVLGLFAVTVSAAPATALPQQAAPASKAGVGAPCTKLERMVSLAVEQRRVLKLVGEFRVLRNQNDLERLSQPNPKTGTQFAFLSHMFASMKGNGIAIVNIGEHGPGKPAFITYRPNPKAKDVLDPFGPDFPYTLAGWGYVAPYQPGQPPSWPDDPGLRCLAGSDWFVHERSAHPADTWQNIPVPPEEEFLGQVPGSEPPTAEECQCEVAISHGRFWDIHFWLRGASPFPSISIFNHGRPIPGFDPVLGLGFFHPEQPSPGSDFEPVDAKPAKHQHRGDHSQSG